MQRSINAPDWEWGTEEMAWQWLGIGKHVWKGLVDAGVVPPPATWSRETEYWSWDQVWAIGRMLPFMIERSVKSRLGKKATSTADQPDGTEDEPARTRAGSRGS